MATLPTPRNFNNQVIQPVMRTMPTRQNVQRATQSFQNQVARPVNNYMTNNQRVNIAIPQAQYNKPFREAPVRNTVKSITGGLTNVGQSIGRGILDPMSDFSRNATLMATGQQPLNYNELKSPITKGGYQVMNGPGTNRSAQEVLANLGGIADPILNAYLLKSFGNKKYITDAAKGIYSKEAKMKAMKILAKDPRLGRALGLMGFTSGLEEGKNKSVAGQVGNATLQGAGQYVGGRLMTAGGVYAPYLIKEGAGAVKGAIGKVANRDVLAKVIDNARVSTPKAIRDQFRIKNQAAYDAVQRTNNGEFPVKVNRPKVAVTYDNKGKPIYDISASPQTIARDVLNAMRELPNKNKNLDITGKGGEAWRPQNLQLSDITPSIKKGENPMLPVTPPGEFPPTVKNTAQVLNDWKLPKGKKDELGIRVKNDWKGKVPFRGNALDYNPPPPPASSFHSGNTMTDVKPPVAPPVETPVVPPVIKPTNHEDQFRALMSDPANIGKIKGWLKNIKDPIKKAKYQAIYDELGPKKVNKPGTPFDPSQPSVSVSNVSTREKLNRLLTSPSVTLQKMGAAGKAIDKLMAEQVYGYDKYKGHFQTRIETALDGLSAKEQNLLRDVSEGKVKTDNVKVNKALAQVDLIRKDMAAKAQKLGLEVMGPDGKKVPFKPLENFFPHTYDAKTFNNPQWRSEAIQAITKDGKVGIAEANSLLDMFIKSKKGRPAGSLEHARVVNLPGYEQNFKKAWERYIDDSARRFSEAEQYGLHDEAIVKALDDISAQGGDRKFAEDVFRKIVHAEGEKTTGTRIVDVALKYQLITKLSLSFITNATQVKNAAVVGGVFRTLKDVIKVYAPWNSKKYGRIAKDIGALDDSIIRGEAENLSLDSVLGIVLGPFSAIERKNRVVSSTVGREYTQAVINKYLANPVGQKAQRQLSALGLDLEAILKAGKITPDDILNRGAKNFSDMTQFKVDARNIPLAWKSDIGRLVTNLQSFSFKQSKFLGEQVWGEMKHGNVLPLLRLIAWTIPEVYATGVVRNVITRKPWDDKLPKTPKDLAVRVALGQGDLGASKINNALYTKKATDQLIKDKRTAGVDKTRVMGDWANLATNIAGYAGTTASDIAKTGNNAFVQPMVIAAENAKYGKERPKKDPYLALKKQAVEIAPFIGKGYSNAMMPWPKSDSTKTADEKEQQQIYFNGIAEQEKGFTTAELTASRAILSSKDGTEQMIPGQYKANAFINFPKVLAAHTEVNRKLKDHDPFYDLDPLRQQDVLLAKSPLYGESGDLKKTVLYNKPWYAGFRADQATYFQKLKDKGIIEDKESDYPAISPALQSKQDAFFKLGSGKAKQAYLQANPDLLKYWDSKDDYTNKQRASIGMPPMPEDNGGGFKGFAKTLPKMKVSRPTISMPKITATKRKVSMPKLKVVKPSNSKITKASLARGR